MNKKIKVLIMMTIIMFIFTGMSFAGSSADATAGSDATGGNSDATGGNAGVDFTYAPTTTSRGDYAPGHMTAFSPLVHYNGPVRPGYTCSTMKELLTFGNIFTESQLKSMADGNGIRGAEVVVTLMDSNMKNQKPTIHPIAKERTITVYIQATPPPVSIRRGAFITVAMKSVKGISLECLGKAGVEALEIGANSLFVTAEGYDITQSQHSVSVGPGVSFSSIGGSDGAKGVTGGGGLSYSYGVFGKNCKPFQRFMALYVEDTDHKYTLQGEEVQK